MTKEELKWEELEERIKELEKEKCELLGLIQGKDRDDYLAGAEPREKRIAELENENAELKKRIEWLDMAIDCDIPVADKIAELEKKIENIRNYLAYNIPHELINEATYKIWHMI